MWVYHMLRRKIGDERFFATLKGLIQDYTGRDMALDDIRRAFIEAAPEEGLEQFFSQWLDRVGAPRIEAKWSMVADDQVQVVLDQKNEGEPFMLDIELELLFDDGTTRREIASLSDRQTKMVHKVPTGVIDVLIDPDRDLLLWRPTYTEVPSVDGVPLSATADWMDPSAYVGTYHIEMFQMNISVFANEKGLFVDVGGDVKQLYPHKPHHFLTLVSSVEFVVENGRAMSFVVKLEGGVEAKGVLVD